MKLCYLAAALVFLGLVLSKFDPDTGFSELAGFGETWAGRQLPEIRKLHPYVKESSGGYDGQFYAQIALDPTLRNPGLNDAIDSPPYRARRIALPALAFVLGAGQPAVVLQIYCLLNVVCWFILGWLLWQWMPPTSWPNFARWFFCMFSMGALESVRLALVDLPAVVLMVATIQLLEKHRDRWSWIAAGAAVFAKETAVLNLVHYFTPGELERGRGVRRAALGTAIVLALFAAWYGYIRHQFPGQGPGVYAAANFSLPGVALARSIAAACAQIYSGNFDSRYVFRILAVAGLLAQGLHLTFHRQPNDARWRMGIVYTALFLCLGDAVWTGYWAACRIALPVTIAFATLLPHNRLFWPALLVSNLPVLHAIGRWL